MADYELALAFETKSFTLEQAFKNDDDFFGCIFVSIDLFQSMV